MTRIGITQPFLSKYVMFFKCLLDLHSLTFQTGLSLISPCQHRTPRTIVHSSTFFILRTTMIEIRKWTFKFIRLVDTSSQPFSSFVNSQPFIHASHLPFVVHFLIMHHFYRVLSRFEHMSIGVVYALPMVPQLNQALCPFPDFIQQFAP
jgi:hypothetical protein